MSTDPDQLPELDQRSQRVLDALRELQQETGGGVDRQVVAARADLDDEAVYFLLKELRQAGLVVSKGRPLVYKVTGDPRSDEADGWRTGLGQHGRRTDDAEVDRRVLDVVGKKPQVTLQELREVDDLVDLAGSRVYAAIRRLEADGRLRGTGRPRRYALADESTAPSTTVEPLALHQPEVRGFEKQVAERRAQAGAWYDARKWQYEGLRVDAEAWLRRLLDDEVRDRKAAGDDVAFEQAVVDARLKTRDSFVAKLARLCGAAGKRCVRCRAGETVHGPHFYYGDEAGSIDKVCRDVEDLVGVRVTVPSEQEQSAAADLIAAAGLEPRHEEIGGDKEVPGYRGTHVTTLLPHARQGLEGIRFEVQVRTVFQDAAARIEHALLYKGSEGERRDLEPFEKRQLLTIFGQMEMAESIFNQMLNR
ncbi:hypothetical protein L615_007600000060 [Nocardioides sp. J9]|uniref:hypothetical protein n=1 Tax=Nocardioides sp. J9 TaxID=935844 RepID=UPI00119F29CA|nr:hypothetical protein [Nocardioides sp. J9]TWG91882.1 hypothetical protein L615_007600000060 [Nocardioides sp. J9]